MTPLQKAAQAVIDRWDSPSWKDQQHTAEYINELRKALDAEIAQSVEPVAVFNGLVDSGEHGAFNLDMLKMIPRGAYLYLHPPQPQATTPVPDDAITKEIEIAIVDHCMGGDLWVSASLGTDRIKRLLSAAQGEKP